MQLANDIKYHLKCSVTIQRQSKTENETQPREMDDISKVISDIEIINIINSELQNPSGITLNMFDINQRYRSLLENNGHKCVNQNPSGITLNMFDINQRYRSLLENNGHKCVNQNYRKYLKTLINDSI